MLAAWLPMRYPLTATWPEGSHDVRRSSAPVKPGDGCTLDAEHIEQGDRIVREHDLLAVSRRRLRQESSGSVAAKIGNEHSIASTFEHWCRLREAVDVVRPAVQQQHGLPIFWSRIH
jgi:hypothetical protein